MKLVLPLLACIAPTLWLAAAQAAPKSYTYTCTLIGSRSAAASMRLRLSTASATVQEGASVAQRYKFDPSYRPRTGTDLRYRANADRWLLVEKTLPKGGYALRTGGRGGFAKLQVRYDSFGSWKYLCRR